MIRLYIDFDGVVMDSIPPLYDALEKSGVNVNKEEEIREFFANYDYNNVVNDKLLLNDSINCINKLIKSKKDDYMDCIFVRPYGKDKVNHIGVDPKKSKTIVTFEKYSDHNLVIAELTIY